MSTSFIRQKYNGNRSSCCNPNLQAVVNQNVSSTLYGYAIAVFLYAAFCSTTINAAVPMPTHDSGSASVTATIDTVFLPLVAKLYERGADTAFVEELLLHKSVRFKKKYVRINVTGYRKKRDYSNEYNSRSVRKGVAFLNANDSLLSVVEKLYDVPKQVLAALLWIETRHGAYLGKHHVPTVYCSLALADFPDFIQWNKDNLKDDFDGDSLELQKLEKKIEQRAKKKAGWAVDQLLALEKMHGTSPIAITELFGSYAGAFGIPQFIPSSYVSWATDGNGDNAVNLFHVEDAVHSAANYLKTNGWGPTPEEQQAAVFHYNNSTDYANAVLTLAARIEKSTAE